jgi:hypothetical protein
MRIEPANAAATIAGPGARPTQALAMVQTPQALRRALRETRAMLARPLDPGTS